MTTCNKPMRCQLDYGHAKLTTESRRRGDKGNENTESGHTQTSTAISFPF